MAPKSRPTEELDRIEEVNLVGMVDSVPPKSYTASIIALCVCMATHSYLLISVFPYSAFLAIELIPSVDQENAGSYAGLVASSFMIGRAVTSYFWGKAADKYGRVTVLYTSLGLSAIFSLLFGLAPTFPLACLVRFMLGASNGLIGTIKTIVSEMAQGDERRETRGMSIVVGMWGWGFLAAPAISGALAEPVRQYNWEGDGILHGALERFPFLLPNILGTVLCICGLLTVYFFVDETLPNPRSLRYVGSDIARSFSCCFGSRYQKLTTLKHHESDADLNYSHNDETQMTTDSSAGGATMLSLLSNKDTRIALVIYWAYSFVGLTVDESFPLFCVSKEAGFGLSESKIGEILSLCGLIFAVCQYFVCAAAYDKLGLYGSIRFGAMFSAPVMFLMPLSRLLNTGSSDLRWSTFTFLSLVMATYRVFALVFFSNITVALNRTVSVSHRATMNGLSMLGGSVAKGIGPIFAGFLASGSIRLLGNYASLLIFGFIGVAGCGVMISTFYFLHEGPKCLPSTAMIEQDEEACEQVVELVGSNKD